MKKHGKLELTLDLILVDVFAICIVLILLILSSFIPYHYEDKRIWLPVESITEKQEIQVPENKHILTEEELGQLYECYPEINIYNPDIQEFTYTEAQLLMHVARAEGGETLEGQLWVMGAIINRLYDDSFPDTITEVIFQDGQFEVVTNGSYLQVELNANSHIALAMIESGWNNTRSATYWEANTNSKNSWHATNLVYITEIAGNRYYHE